MSVKPKTAWMVYCRFATYYVCHHRASFPVLFRPAHCCLLWPPLSQTAAEFGASCHALQEQ